MSINSVTVDESATTGVSVTVSGSSLPNGAQVTAASTDCGSSQPSGTGTVSISGAVFYDVFVASSNGPLGSGVNAQVSISNPSFTSSSVMEYYDGNDWVSVATTFNATDTLSGIIPASALAGTPIAVSTALATQTCSVIFTESGLPSGAGWWVDLNGNNRSSTSNVIDFSMPNGTYTYSARQKIPLKNEWYKRKTRRIKVIYYFGFCYCRSGNGR